MTAAYETEGRGADHACSQRARLQVARITPPHYGRLLSRDQYSVRICWLLFPWALMSDVS